MRTRFHRRTDLAIDGFVAGAIASAGTFYAAGMPGAALVAGWIVLTVGFGAALTAIRIARAMYERRGYILDALLGFRPDVASDEIAHGDAWDRLRAELADCTAPGRGQGSRTQVERLFGSPESAGDLAARLDDHLAARRAA